MYDISVNDLRDSTTASLEVIKNRIEEELQRRRNLERVRLINEFQKAWSDLKNAHIKVTYSEEYDDDIAYLDQWDGFNFD
jgi:hypothetical protein